MTGGGSESERFSVILIDDHPLFRVGLAALIDAEPGLRVVGHAGTSDEALALYDHVYVDLVVTVMQMGDGSGIDLVHSLAARRHVRILGLSGVVQPVKIAEMLRAGATSFALKSQSFPEVRDAIWETLEGRRYLAPSIKDEVEKVLNATEAQPHDRLTPREREISALVLRGYTNKEIGQSLFIAPRTVETHRLRMMRKLGIHTMSELIVMAARTGALD
ncbi:MAG TPA: response regulator transcription factor [Kofleriaceae bacterium]|nr:response regulator transcription factor [Kofleriaceae bacterium]